MKIVFWHKSHRTFIRVSYDNKSAVVPIMAWHRTIISTNVVLVYSPICDVLWCKFETKQDYQTPTVNVDILSWITHAN